MALKNWLMKVRCSLLPYRRPMDEEEDEEDGVASINYRMGM